MTIGLRAILLGLALILFVVAAVDDDADLIAWGLAALAAGLLVGELGRGTRLRRR